MFIPFRAREQGCVYYGQNAISKNLIIANRKELLNGNGFVLGVSGSGKSFTARREMVNLALSTEDDIIVVDPESEYRPLVEGLGGEVINISAVSSNHINARDMEQGYGACCSGLTQNVDDLLQSHTARTMLANSNFSLC